MVREECKGIKVLVVDDLEPNHKLMKKFLDMLECESDYVYNGQEAIEKFKEGQYDICFMDFQMPVMGGIEATKIIRGELKVTTPILALTGSATQDELEVGLNEGMNDSVRKPVNLIELQHKILKHVS